MKNHYERSYTPPEVHEIYSEHVCAIWLIFTLLHLNCQSENFQVWTCQISETIESIELKLSGNIEGINKLEVLKFQSNLIRLSIKSKIRNSE